MRGGENMASWKEILMDLAGFGVLFLAFSVGVLFLYFQSRFLVVQIKRYVPVVRRVWGRLHPDLVVKEE